MLLFVSPEQEPVQSTAPLFTERCPAGFPSPAADEPGLPHALSGRTADFRRSDSLHTQDAG